MQRANSAPLLGLTAAGSVGGVDAVRWLLCGSIATPGHWLAHSHFENQTDATGYAPRFDGTHDGVWSLALGLGLSLGLLYVVLVTRLPSSAAGPDCAANWPIRISLSVTPTSAAPALKRPVASSQQQRPAKQAWFCIHVHFPSYFSSGFSSRNTACVADHLRRQYTDMVLTRARADKTGLIYPARVAWCF